MAHWDETTRSRLLTIANILDRPIEAFDGTDLAAQQLSELLRLWSGFETDAAREEALRALRRLGDPVG